MASGGLAHERLCRYAVIIAQEVEADDRHFARLGLDRAIECEAKTLKSVGSAARSASMSPALRTLPSIRARIAVSCSAVSLSMLASRLSADRSFSLMPSWRFMRPSTSRDASYVCAVPIALSQHFLDGQHAVQMSAHREPVEVEMRATA